MARTSLVCVLLVLAVVLTSAPTTVEASAGANCAVCTLIVDLVQKIAVSQANGNCTKAFDYICGNFQGNLAFLAPICDTLTGLLSIPIQLALDVGEIPDTTCQTGWVLNVEEHRVTCFFSIYSHDNQAA